MDEITSRRDRLRREVSKYWKRENRRQSL